MGWGESQRVAWLVGAGPVLSSMMAATVPGVLVVRVWIFVGWVHSGRTGRPGGCAGSVRLVSGKGRGSGRLSQRLTSVSECPRRSWRSA